MRRNGFLTRLVATALLAVSANSLAQASTFDRPPAASGGEPAFELPAESEQPL
jgi:hypothetical protein